MFKCRILAEVEQGTPEWLQLRKKGIGGSDASVVLGLNPYKTPLELFYEKTGQITDNKSNWFMRRGKALEPVLRQEFSQKFAKKVQIPKGIFQHQKPELEFMLCSLDGFTEDGRIQEFKTASREKDWGEEGTDQIPGHYYIQIQHNLIVTGATVCDVLVSIAGNEPKYYEVFGHPDIQEQIIADERNFWFNHVQANVKPEPVTIDEIIKKYQIIDGQEALATKKIRHAVEEYRKLKETEKEIKEQIEEQKEIIQKFLGEQAASVLIDPETNRKLVTWHETKGREMVDTKLLRSKYPEIFAEVKTESKPYRTFLLK